MMEKPKYKIVEIEWFDAQSGFGQAEEVAYMITNMKTVHSYSIGYLLNQDKESIKFIKNPTDKVKSTILKMYNIY